MIQHPVEPNTIAKDVKQASTYFQISVFTQFCMEHWQYDKKKSVATVSVSE
jgi:hypothetical protein